MRIVPLEMDFDANQWLTSTQEALKQYTAHADSAKERKGEKYTGPKRTREELIATFDESQPSHDDQIRHSVLSYSYPPCLTSNLEPIFIDNLLLETMHRGRVLTVRALGEPQYNWAVQNAVEDGKGNTEMLSVHNFDLDVTQLEVLPKGARVAIKEPYYKLALDGYPTIMVTHPSDIVRMNSSDMDMPLEMSLDRPSVKSMMDYKNEGNMAFKTKDYFRANEVYTTALQSDVGAEVDLIRRCCK